MTAQIIIGNGHAVVVASDGASTTNRRTYGGAEKIIPAPDPHRIAVLHAGSVDIHGVSIVGLVADWVKSLPSQPLETVGAYSKSFTKFLEETIPTYAPESQLYLDYLDALYFALKIVRTAIDDASQGAPPTVEMIAATWNEKISEFEKDASVASSTWASEFLSTIAAPGDGNPADVCRRNDGYSRHVFEWEISTAGILEHLFADLPTNDAIRQAQADFIQSLATTFYPVPWDHDHSLNFVGYGRTEVLPSFSNVSYFGMVKGRLYSREWQTETAQRVRGGHFLMNTIGMSDDIDRFIRDIGFPLTASEESLGEALDELMSSNSEKSLGEMREQIISEFHDQFMSKRAENFDRVRGTLSLLNEQNLLSIADGLIRMQELAMDAGGDLPSVGSGVLSAVITRADGFVWSDEIDSHFR